MAQSAPNLNELLTLPEAARRYGLGAKLVRRAAKSGEFPVYRAGGAWPRVIATEFEVWIRSTRIPAAQGSSAHVEHVLAKVEGLG